MTSTISVAVPSISDNVEFILSHLDDLWPKLIAFGDNWSIRVNTFRDIIRQFYEVDLSDCRINIYPDYERDYFHRRLYALESRVPGGNGIPPSCLLIDIDKGAFVNNLGFSAISLLNKALMKTLNNIDIRFHGKFKPTILWTGNGYHIIQPVQFSNIGNNWLSCLGGIKELHDLHKDPDREFIRWIGLYLSGKKSDPANSKTVSFKNNYLRVPGTINSKNNSQVRIIQRWDGQRPAINWLLRDFRRYLIEQKTKKKPKKKRPTANTPAFSTNWSKQ